MSCTNPMKYLNFLTVDAPDNYAKACGVYMNGTFARITACFCIEDDCNGNKAYIKGLVYNHIDGMREQPLVDKWLIVRSPDEKKTAFKCYEWNLDNTGPNPYAPPPPEEVGEPIDLSPILGYVAIGVGVVAVCACILPVAYRLKEAHRKKRLAETWEQRVKEAGEEIERSGGSSVFSGSGTSQSSKRKK